MIKLVVLGVVAFVISLLIMAPAQLVSEYLPPDVQATGLQGTLWQGQASEVQIQGFNLGEVSWDMQPLSLFAGRLQSDVRIDREGMQGQGVIGVGFNSVRVADARLDGSSELLAPYLTGYGVNINGRFEADIRALQFNESGPQALDGDIVWRDARLVNPTELQLGDVNVTLSQQGGAAIADLKNNGGELRVTGGGRLEQGWEYNARLRAEPTQTTPKIVRDALPYIGQPDNRGGVTLSRQGTLNIAAGL